MTAKPHCPIPGCKAWHTGTSTPARRRSHRAAEAAPIASEVAILAILDDADERDEDTIVTARRIAALVGDLSEMLDAETALARRYAHAPSRVQMVAALAKARDEDLARLTEDNGVTKSDHLVAGTTWAKAMEVAATATETDKENR